jgi:hypothetical protein
VPPAGVRCGSWLSILEWEHILAPLRERPGEPALVGASAGVRLLETASSGTALSDADEALQGGRRAVLWPTELRRS